MKDIIPELNNKDYIVDLMKYYDVRFCFEAEADDLVSFLNKYWKQNHIFVLSRELLNWQHYDKTNKRYNFVIAKLRESGEIHSILGFVPTYQFDSNIKNVEIWPCIWKSRDDVHVKGLGVSLYYYLKNNIPNIETISILGISEIALSIYKHWNFSTGKIKQYYILNESISDFQLVKNEAIDINKYLNSNVSIGEIQESELLESCKALNGYINRYKSINYYINRFCKHPLYKYQIYLVKELNEPKLILFTRECIHNGNRCLRIVDFIGNFDNLGNIYYQLQDILRINKYEYVDFINVGLNPKIVKGLGFRDIDDTNIIIPNYYEPFLLENVKLDYAYKTILNEPNCVFVKADADQDRPNLL